MQEETTDDDADGKIVDWSLLGVSRDHLLLYYREIDAVSDVGTRAFRLYDLAGTVATVLQLGQDDWRGERRADPKLVGNYVVFRHPTESYYILHDVTTGVQRQVRPFAE